MYVPTSFAETRPGPLVQFLDARGLGTLIHADDEGIEVTNMPIFRVDDTPATSVRQLEGRRLVTHIARANPLVKRLCRNRRLTVVFLGPNHYVSGDWNGRQPTVPTWNYMALHLHGHARTFDDEQRLLAVLDRTAAIHEPRVGGGWRRHALEQTVVDKLMAGIVGLEFTICSLEANFKLHQHAPPRDAEHVAEALRAAGDTEGLAVADAMQAYLSGRDDAALAPRGAGPTRQ